MFYCETCADANKWPKAVWLPLSRGACEVCGVRTVCFDVPSSFLPPQPAVSADQSGASHEP